MQLLVPYTNHHKNAEIFTPVHLRLMIRGCKEIATKRYPNHPIAKSWKYHTYFLCDYAFALLNEQGESISKWNTFDIIHEVQMKLNDTGPPPWWGDKRVHHTHRSYLLSLDFDHYNSDFQPLNPSKYIYLPIVNEDQELKRINRLKKNNMLIPQHPTYT